MSSGSGREVTCPQVTQLHGAGLQGSSHQAQHPRRVISPLQGQTGLGALDRECPVRGKAISFLPGPDILCMGQVTCCPDPLGSTREKGSDTEVHGKFGSSVGVTGVGADP